LGVKMDDKPRNKGGRPAGSRNKATAAIRTVMDRLEKVGWGDHKTKLHPELWLLQLQAIGMDSEREPGVRITALRVLLNYRYGLPHAAIDLTTTHELGESATALLMRIAQSDQHRRALEELETMRRKALPSATVIDDDEPADVEAS